MCVILTTHYCCPHRARWVDAPCPPVALGRGCLGFHRYVSVQSDDPCEDCQAGGWQGVLERCARTPIVREIEMHDQAGHEREGGSGENEQPWTELTLEDLIKEDAYYADDEGDGGVAFAPDDALPSSIEGLAFRPADTQAGLPQESARELSVPSEGPDACAIEAEPTWVFENIDEPLGEAAGENDPFKGFETDGHVESDAGIKLDDTSDDIRPEMAPSQQQHEQQFVFPAAPLFFSENLAARRARPRGIPLHMTQGTILGKRDRS